MHFPPNGAVIVNLQIAPTVYHAISETVRVSAKVTIKYE